MTREQIDRALEQAVQVVPIGDQWGKWFEVHCGGVYHPGRRVRAEAEEMARTTREHIRRCLMEAAS